MPYFPGTSGGGGGGGSTSVALPALLGIPPDPIAGTYYGYPAAHASAGLTLPGGQLFASPVLVSKKATKPIAFIGVNVTGATASTVIRCGIYGSNDTWVPTNLIADLGTMDATLTGHKEVTVPAATGALEIGLYWIVTVGQGGSPSVSSAGGGFVPVSQTGAPAGGGYNGYRSAASTHTAALPATFDLGTPWSVPQVVLRF